MDEGCCPYQRSMDVLGRRHALPIIWLLQQGSPRRFNDIKRSLQVNPVTLSQRLKDLEDEGIIRRHAYDDTPPRVDYDLTPKGRDLVPLMKQLCAWAERHGQVQTA